MSIGSDVEYCTLELPGRLSGRLSPDVIESLKAAWCIVCMVKF